MKIFSLGIIRGKSFKKYLDCCPPYGNRTKSISLPLQELKDTDWKVSVYQSFADSEHVEICGDNGAVYVGAVAINPNLYQAKDAILLQMELNDSYSLQMIFSEMRDGERVEVETQTINLRGNENS